MKVIVIAITVTSLGFIIWLVGLAYMSRSGVAAGLLEGKLSLCPNKPNCVCSEEGSNAEHFVEPVALPVRTYREIFPVLRAVIQDMGGMVQTESEAYLAATFHSALFGFIDDLELRIDKQQGVIHLRSASRVGYSDAGVNRKRIEQFKALFRQQIEQ